MGKPGRKKLATKVWEEDKTTRDAGTAHTLEISHLDADASAAGSMIVEHNASENFYGLPSQKKSLKFTNPYVRRSGRIKRSELSAGLQGAKKSGVGCIDLVESEKKPLHSEEASKVPIFTENNVGNRPQVQEADGVPNTNLSNLEEKIDYLLSAVDEFKSQMPRRPNESHSGEPNYKDMHRDAERKIEALMSDNFELVKKLEYARGELSAYRAVTKDSMSTWKEASAAILALLPQPSADDLEEKDHSKIDNPVTVIDEPTERKIKRRKGKQ